MSMRDSRVVSQFINEEFSFLRDEMEKTNEGEQRQSPITELGSEQLELQGSCLHEKNISAQNLIPSDTTSLKDSLKQLTDTSSSSLLDTHLTDMLNNSQSVPQDLKITSVKDNIEGTTTTRVPSVDSGLGLNPITEDFSVDQVLPDETVRMRPKKQFGANVDFTEATDSGDTEDEEVAEIYDESVRVSKWLFVREDDANECHTESPEDTSSQTTEDSESSEASNSEIVRHSQSSSLYTPYKRSYKQVSLKRVQRQSSVQTFAQTQASEVSAEKTITIDKPSGNDKLGFHISGDYPTKIDQVDSGSIAEQQGFEVGDVLLAINFESVLPKTLSEVVQILNQAEGSLTIELCKESSLSLMAGDQNEACTEIYSAFLYKLTNATLNLWKKRWFVLKSDNCLYYHKQKESKEILGAIPLSGYTVQKTVDLKRAHSIKLMHRTKTYCLAAADENELLQWMRFLKEATQGQSTMDNWLAVTAHHVSLPALSIKNIDCDGYLYKLGGRHKSWKKRYCVLKDGCLFYYCDINSHSAQGVAHLHGYTTIENPKSNKKNAFELAPPESKMRTFYFYTDTEVEKERWLRFMKLSIGRWVQVMD